MNWASANLMRSDCSQEYEYDREGDQGGGNFNLLAESTFLQSRCRRLRQSW